MTLNDSSLNYAAIAWANNTVWFDLQADSDWQTSNFYATLDLGFVGNPAPQVSEVQSPSNTGKIYFEIQEYLKTFIEFELPTLPQANIQNTNTEADFWIKFRSTKNNVSTVLATTNFKAIAAGLESHEFTLASQSDFLSANKFLTKTTGTRRICEGMSDFIYLFPNTSAYTVHVNLFYEDGTDHAYSLASASTAGKICIIPTGYENLGITNHASQKVIGYSVDVGGEVLDYELVDADLFWAFYYKNSLGGLDSCLCTGELILQNEARKNVVQRGKSSKGIILDPSSDYFVNSVEKARKGKASTGFLTEDQANSLKEMLESEQVFHLVDGKFREILIEGSYEYFKKDSDLIGYSFEFKYF